MAWLRHLLDYSPSDSRHPCGGECDAACRALLERAFRRDRAVGRWKATSEFRPSPPHNDEPG